MNDVKYFNVPIRLYQDFLEDSASVLSDVLVFALYEHSEKKLEKGSEIVRFKAACDYYDVDDKNATINLHKAKQIVYYPNDPRVGISLTMFWDFYSNQKSEFEKVSLLAYLAIRSILQNKSYFKLTNNYWLARMDGKSNSVKSFNELSSGVKKYSTEYQLTKIKKELRDSWGLVYYGKNVRGFYVSNTMTVEDLVFEVFKNRQKKSDGYADIIKQAEKQAVINLSRPLHDH